MELKYNWLAGTINGLEWSAMIDSHCLLNSCLPWSLNSKRGKFRWKLKQTNSSCIHFPLFFLFQSTSCWLTTIQHHSVPQHHRNKASSTLRVELDNTKAVLQNPTIVLSVFFGVRISLLWGASQEVLITSASLQTIPISNTQHHP